MIGCIVFATGTALGRASVRQWGWFRDLKQQKLIVYRTMVTL